MHYRLRTLLIVLASLLPLSAKGQDKADPGEALYGEWEIVEVTFAQRVQKLPEPPVGWFIFEKDQFLWIMYGDVKKELDKYHKNKGRKLATRMTQDCVIEQREIHVRDRFDEKIRFTALYEIKDETLRFVWNEKTGERPTSFEALKDPSLALYVAKKVK